MRDATWCQTRSGEQISVGDDVIILTPINYHDGYGQVVRLLPDADPVPCVMVRDIEGRRAVVNAVNISVDR